MAKPTSCTLKLGFVLVAHCRERDIRGGPGSLGFMDTSSAWLTLIYIHMTLSLSRFDSATRHPETKEQVARDVP